MLNDLELELVDGEKIIAEKHELECFAMIVELNNSKKYIFGSETEITILRERDLPGALLIELIKNS